MMKIYILLLVSSMLPFTMYSFISLLLLMSTILAFSSQFKKISMIYKTITLDSFFFFD